MKIIFVFSVCCLAVALAARPDFDLRRQIVHDEVSKECTEEFKQAGITEVADNAAGVGCYEACIHKKLGIFNEDGSLNFDVLTGGKHTKEFEEHAQRVYQRCRDAANGDSCKVSYCLSKAREF